MDLERNNIISKRLYIGAWAMEILAAGIGLYIAYYFFKSTLDITTDNNSLGYLPVLGFVMVAIVELTRIPFAQTIYYKRKYIFVPVLLIMIFLNWETMWVSFNIYINQTTKEAISLYNQVEELKSENIIKDAEKLNESSLNLETINNNYNEEYIRIRKENINNIASKELDKQNLKNSVDTPQIQKLEQEIQDIKDTITSEKKTFESDKKNEEESYDKKEKSRLIELQQIQSNIITTRNQLNTLNKTNKLGKGKDKKNLQNRIDKLEKEEDSLKQKKIPSNLSKIEDKFKSKIVPLQKSLSEKKETLNKIKFIGVEGIQVQLEQLTNEIDIIQEEYENELQQLKVNKQNKIASLENQEKNIKNIALEKLEIKKQIIQLENKLTLEAERLPVYWFARSLSGWFDEPIIDSDGKKKKKQLKDITPNDLDRTVLIWFGSLALVVATSGTALAFASFVMGDKNINPRRNRSSTRALFLSLIRYVRNPRIKKVKEVVEKEVVVTKVVPEDKVVYKEVPKIQEVIKKEIVYVPVPTAREDLIKDKK